ncbi:MAG: GSU2403 family nucleotidyltransferase fold protein [Kiritimatiellae bacterium]|nr:GSU2403 family nucleotidyltransferase fold protein [Kiritimatiellia bacterium]
MDNKQYQLICNTLNLLQKADVLEHMVVIGSWCIPVYEQYFKGVPFQPGIRTRDIDLLIPTPLRLIQPVNLEELLTELGFIISYKGDGGYVRFVHPDLMLEFVVPERGRGHDKPYDLPALGINAQPLQFMDFLCVHLIKLTFGETEIAVPHPARFALLKLMVAGRRDKAVKKENDLRQATQVIQALIQSNEQKLLHDTFLSMPKKRRVNVRKTLAELPLANPWADVFVEE